MKKKLYLILIVISVIAANAIAQTEISDFSFSSGGGMIVKDDFSSSYSIGELFMVTDGRISENSSSNLLASATNSSESESISNLSIYPNPSTGTINVNLYLKEEGKINIGVFDILGKQVFVDNLSNENILSFGAHSQKVELNDLNNGMYFMEIIFVSSKGFSTKTIQKINITK